VSGPAYRSVVLDVDSTLCGVEGIDWLARRRSPGVAEEIARLTDRAMNGEVPIEAVYGERLALIRPSRKDVDALADEYRRTLAADAQRILFALRAKGLRLVLVSAGIRGAILPLAKELGFEPDDVHAVELRWDSAGAFVDYDVDSPMTRQRGKAVVVSALSLPSPVLAVGDGATDLEMRDAVDAFGAYVGFARREAVVAGADVIFTSFADLGERVLGS
jgi:phosphoserine phosphatase